MQEAFERWVELIMYGDGLKELLSLVALCSARTVAMILVLPPTAGQKLSGMVRAALPIWIGMYIAWGQPPTLLKELSMTMLAVLLLKETLIGALIGFAAGTIFWVAEGVGSMIDNMAGYNNVQQTNPQSSDQSTPIGNLLSELSMFAFWALGGMMAMVGVLFESYAWWPMIETVPPSANLLENFARVQVSDYMMAIARIAAPAMLILLLIDLAFGLLNKTAEKLEPSSMAQPVKGAVALVMVALLLSVFFDHFRDTLSLKNFGRQLQMLVGR